MLENNNLKICRKLVWREFQFHKARSILLMGAITLVSMLCTFSFALGHMIHDGLRYGYRVQYGSMSHIVYDGLNSSQAAVLSRHTDVKDTVLVRPVGVLSDDMMEYRNVKLAAVSPDWAKATDAVPVCGRMPEAEWEIALDELTMRSLAITPKEGTEVVVRWTPTDGGGERTDTFRLCGWWDSGMAATETCAWITPETARRLYPDVPDSVILGVTLYRPGDLEAQAKELLYSLGVDDVTYTTNLAYNRRRLERIGAQSMPYYMINIVVGVCGIVMVYNIVYISVGHNMLFYGRVKSLGMSPRQIRRLLSEQAGYLCLPAVPVGWLLGFGLCTMTAPYVLLGIDGHNPALLFFSLLPFVYSGLLTWLVTWAACMLSVHAVSGVCPARAMRFREGEKGRLGNRCFGRRKKRRRMKISFMELSGFRREKGRTALAACSLLLALTLLCGLWTQYASADEGKYMAAVSYSDYLIADTSAATKLQRYNPQSHSITPEFMKALKRHEAVADVGTIRTMEVLMYADKETRAPIVEYYEGTEKDGSVRKETMSGLPDWGKGYEKFRRTGEYVGIAVGVDGLALSTALVDGEYVEGSFDRECFATGDYVVASSASGVNTVSTPPVGSQVEIGGRFFEIMAVVSYENRMLTGSDSREAEFSISYYMPVKAYEQLFPESGIRNVMVNIDYAGQKAFEEFLGRITQDNGIQVTMRSAHQQDFANALFHKYIIPMFVGAVLLLIGVLNFGNALVSSMLVRRKELAVYESLGMTHTQIRRLLVWEGILYAGVQTLVIVPAVAVLTWLWGRWWINHSSSSWCATWRYSLAPMWLALPFLFAAAFVIPRCCFGVVMKESVVERLRAAE